MTSLARDMSSRWPAGAETQDCILADECFYIHTVPKRARPLVTFRVPAETDPNVDAALAAAWAARRGRGR